MTNLPKGRSRVGVTRNPDARGRRLATIPVLIVLLTLAAFAARVVGLEAQSLWRDEVDAMCYAFAFPRALADAVAPEVPAPSGPPSACPPLQLTEGDEDSTPVADLTRLAGEIVRHNGPLYYFLLRGWISLAGTSATALRFFSVWFGTLCVPLAYVLGRRLLGPAEGLFFAGWVAASPYLVWYSQEIKMYALLPAVVLAAIYALQRAADGGGVRWWVGQFALTTLTPYVHIWGALLIPVQVFLFLICWPRKWRPWLFGMLSLVLMALPYLPLINWISQRVFIRQETGFPHRTLLEMAQILLSSWSTGRAGWGGSWGEWICGITVILGLLALIFGRVRVSDRRVVVGLLGWMVLPVMGIWFVSLWQPLFTDRYLVWAAPAFYLIAAAGQAFVWRHARWAVLLFLVGVLIVFGVNISNQVAWPLKAQVREAALYVEQDYRADDLIVFQIPHIRYNFDYYFEPQEYEWLDGMYTNHTAPSGEYEMSQDQAAAYIEAATWGYERVWLVASEMEMWDQRLLVYQWLEANRVRAASGSYLWADVYLYTLP